MRIRSLRKSVGLISLDSKRKRRSLLGELVCFGNSFTIESDFFTLCFDLFKLSLTRSRREIESIGVGVTAEAQKVFNDLSKS